MVLHGGIPTYRIKGCLIADLAFLCYFPKETYTISVFPLYIVGHIIDSTPLPTLKELVIKADPSFRISNISPPEKNLFETTDWYLTRA